MSKSAMAFIESAGPRVSLDSVVIPVPGRGFSGQDRLIVPSLTLSQVYGAIAYYLENQLAVDEYIAEGQRKLERNVPPLSQSNPELFARLEAAREKMGSKRSRLSASWRTR